MDSGQVTRTDPRTSEVGLAIFEQNLELALRNDAFVRMYEYPDGLCEPGARLGDLYRFCARRGDFGEGEVEALTGSLMEQAARFEENISEHRLPNGTTLSTSYHPIDNHRLLITTRDITGTKKTAAALLESEERNSLIEQAATEGIYEWSIGESILNASPRMKQIFGIRSAESGATNWNWNERIHPEDFERYKSALREHFKGSADTYECEYRVSDEHGAYRWIRDRGICVRDEQGWAIRLVGAISDLTEHIDRERELAQKTAILESTLENMEQGITMVDEDLRVIAFNQRFLELLEFPPDQFKLGYHMSEAFRFNAERGEYGPGDIEKQIEERMQLAARFEPHHFERSRPDGTIIEVRGVPLPDKSGLVTTYTDVTNLKHAERELAEKEAQLRVALDNMPGGMTLVDKRQNYVFLNQQYIDLHDFPKDLLKVGGNVRDEAEYQAGRGDFGSGDNNARVEEALDNYRVTGSPNWERTVPGGRTLQFSTAPTPDGGNATIVTDITARKQAEEGLRRQNERLRQEIEAHRRSKATIEYLVDEIKSRHNFEEIVGQSDLLHHVLGQLEQVATTDSTVLIQGETGTGKELFVRAIHDLSNRSEQPLVKVNCAALPRELVESELFGHEKGAFTGATGQRKGRFELADKGTIFLDEAGELPAEAQAKLLRVLQEQEFERVGGARTLRTNVRVIAATNRDLKSEADGGRFRSDLYYRLSVFPLNVPPLRQRHTDIPLLAEHFLARYARKVGKHFDGIATGSMKALMEYSWPGNIRELENVIERAAILSTGPLLELSEPLERSIEEDGSREPGSSGSAATLQEVEKAYIKRVLSSTGWTVEGSNGAARILGLNPSTLRGRMRKLGIRKPL